MNNRNTKMIKVTSRGMVSTSRGRRMSPIVFPYRESIDKIWEMITMDRATVMEKLMDGSFIELTVQNYNKDNNKPAKVEEVKPVAPAQEPVKSAKTEEPKAEEAKVEEPVKPQQPAQNQQNNNQQKFNNNKNKNKYQKFNQQNNNQQNQKPQQPVAPAQEPAKTEEPKADAPVAEEAKVETPVTPVNIEEPVKTDNADIKVEAEEAK